MAEYHEFLATLDRDPGDLHAWENIQALGSLLATKDAAEALEATRNTLRDRGELDVVVRLLDVELDAVNDEDHIVDLLLQKGRLFNDDMLDEQAALECFNKALNLRPNDAHAREKLEGLFEERQNWKKFVDKYLEEARVATDRQLSTSMYLSAAEMYARHKPDAPDVEKYLRKALEVDVRNRRAGQHLERLLHKAGRWQELVDLLHKRVDASERKADRVRALLVIAQISTGHLDRPALTLDSMKKVIAADPGHPRALAALAEAYEQDEDWSSLAVLYGNAIKAQRREGGRDADAETLLRVGLLHWKHLDNLEAAEEYFRRIRKQAPAHEQVLAFYREYYPKRNETAKLLQVLRQAKRSAVEDADLQRALSVEIAELAENQLGNPEKAIDAWKSVLRVEPEATDARAALKRLYRRTEKWNALLDLMKDEVDALSDDESDERIALLMEMVTIYRDRLKLDVMVINTYNTILKLDPYNDQALSDLIEKYKEHGRSNDLIAVLTKKAQSPRSTPEQRVSMLREIAELWSERFGNYAQAIKPLEQLLEVAPADEYAIGKLKDIYARRRQWRALISLLQREVARAEIEDRRGLFAEMAQLASGRLGDFRLAIEHWNRVLELPAHGNDSEALTALANLYDRDKRHVALAEVLRRQRAAVSDDGAAVQILERLGALLSDKLKAPQLAAEALQEILVLQPEHGRALRTLREIYANSGDYEALEKLYAKLGQWEDLTESLFGIADRTQDKDERLKVLERAAAVATKHFDNTEKIARAQERVLAADPKNLAAAKALVDIYSQNEKWARLLSTYEILLEYASGLDQKLELTIKIRKLCEEQLGSKALAFQWATRAYKLVPDNEDVFAELERLGAEADAWEDVAAIFDERSRAENIDDSERLRLFRELGDIAMVRLHQPEKAREYQQKVLEFAPNDRDALAALAEIATQRSEWPDLLKVYRQRAELENDLDTKLDLLFRVAFIEEERLEDLTSAAESYRAILNLQPDSYRALRALTKIEEARQNWDGLAHAFERQLEQTADPDQKFDLLMRLGELQETQLDRSLVALKTFKLAFALSTSRKQVHEALERYLGPVDGLDDKARADVATLLLPIYEQADNAEKIATTIGVLRVVADSEAALEYDRRLYRLYAERLQQPQQAYDTALRILTADPEDIDNRAELIALAQSLDNWQDLTAHLEGALEWCADNAADSHSQKTIAIELAQIYQERLQDIERAQRAWQRVLVFDESENAAYDALESIYREGERWPELRGVLMQREGNTLDVDQRIETLLAVCELDESELDDDDSAITLYRRVLDLAPGHMQSFKALERLYESREDWESLEAVLAEESGYVDDPQETIYRRAVLRADRLKDTHGAVDLLEELLARAAEHEGGRSLLERLLERADVRQRIARILEPLYEIDNNWKELCGVLRAQREFASSPLEAVELLSRVAVLQEERLGAPISAFETWLAAFAAEASTERSREALTRLANQLDRWADLADAYEDALDGDAAGDISLRAELLSELAEVYDHRLHDLDRATSAYERLLELDAGSSELAKIAATSLERIYTESENWDALISIVKRSADWAPTSQERLLQLGRVARIYEEQLQDKDAAISAWRDLVSEDPEDTRGLDALERLYAEVERYPELIDILRRRVEISTHPQQKKHHLDRIALLCEEEMKDVSEAIAAHLEVLDYLPDDAQTLVELARLYRADKRFGDLYEVVERQLSLCDEESSRLQFTYDLGVLLHQHLDRVPEALERYAEVLQSSPRHSPARGAVETLIEDLDLGLRACEILEPIYDQLEEHEALVGLLTVRAERSDEPREKLRDWGRVAGLYEQVLDDRSKALDCCIKAVPFAVAEPNLPQLIGRIDRLAAELGREEELIDIFQQIAPDVLDGDFQRRLYLDVADLSRALRQDTDLALEYYQRVLDTTPEDQRALNALESLYRESGAHAELYDVLIAKAEVLHDDLEGRVLALVESARLCEQHLRRPEDAVSAWEQVLVLAPDHKEASLGLEKLYADSDRWHDLVGLLERRLGFAFDVKEAVELRFRLGELYEQQLMDPDAAVENYSAALGGDQGHSGALAALERALDEPGSRGRAAGVLEPVYVAQQDWPKLVRIYEIKLDAADEPGERLELTRDIARLFEEQLEDLEGAFRWYGRVFRETPDDLSVRDQLMRLAAVLENWSGLAHVYQEFLDDNPQEDDDTRSVGLAVAELYDAKLNEVELAHSAYRRVLQGSPDDKKTLARVETLLTRAERWYALVDLYEDATQVAADDQFRIDLYTRLVNTHVEHLKDLNSAIGACQRILELEPDHKQTLDTLDALYQEHNRWDDLAELLRSRIDAVAAGAEEEENALRLRLAKILARRLDDKQGAVDQYELILHSKEGWAEALPPLERLVVDVDCRERIADLLEPIYRAKDWWQKLVVILDAQLGFIEDVPRQVSMLREIADIHATRGGDERLALKALSKAYKLDQSEDVYDALSSMAARMGAWDELVETLEEGIKDQYDYDIVASVLAHIAEIHEVQREDNATAITVWKRALETADSDPVALSALDRLYSHEENYAELGDILHRRQEIAEQDSVRVVLLHRLAELHEMRRSDLSQAIATHKQVLVIEHENRDSLDALQRLLAAEEKWDDLVDVLRQKVDLLQDEPAESRALRLELAVVFQDHVRDAYEAIGQLTQIVAEDPANLESLGRLRSLYESESMWTELVATLDKVAAIEEDESVRADLGFEAAQRVEKDLVEVEQAIERYAAILEISPGHQRARAALEALTKSEESVEQASAVLERLYREAGDFDAIAGLFENKFEILADQPDARLELYRKLAEVQEVGRDDYDETFAVWTRALAEFPEEMTIMSELERLAETRGRWERLTEVVEKQLGELVDAELEYAYATRLAGVYENALENLDKAAEKYQRALAVASDERGALAALDRVYGRAGKFAELAGVLEQQAEVISEPEARAQFLFRLGDLREQQLENTAGAIAAYREVLETEPSHIAARGALERLLSTAESDRLAIIAVLEPIYDSQGNSSKLADMCEAKLSATEDPLDRAQIYSRLAELAEQSLGDPVRALAAAGGWLGEDPQSEQALAEFERLAEVTQRWDEAEATLAGVAQANEDPDIRKMLALKLGEVQLQHKSDLAAAESTYRGVLETDPDCTPALVALERLYRSSGNFEQLAATLKQRAEQTYDAVEKREHLVQAAEVFESLQNQAELVATWREVLDLDESDRVAHTQLVRLYEGQENWQDLVDVLTIASRYCEDATEERQVRTRIAQVHQGPLQDVDEALGAWQAVLDVAPEAGDAIDAMLTIYGGREDWSAVQDLLVRKLDLVAEPAAKIDLLEELAQLAMNKRNAIDDAIGYLYQILDLDGAHMATYQRLNAVLEKGERWHEQVELLERAAESYAALGNVQEELACFARAADVWEGPLDNPDAAGEILEKILARDPGSVAALTRLARIYERQQDWEKCSGVLSQALTLGASGRDAAELYFRLGETEKNRTGDVEAASQHYLTSLQHDRHFMPAIESIETAARSREDWPTVADMVTRRFEQSENDAERTKLIGEMANLYVERLQQPQAVIPLLEDTVRTGAADAKMMSTLCDLYIAAGEVDKAQPIIEELVEKARAARKMKDVANYQRQLGAIYERRGDSDAALASYEEARRINPTDVSTMIGLGKLYLAREAWDKARAIYRSMVLQKLEPGCGVAKPDIYLNLGVIHLRLDEAAKAKGMFQRGLDLDPDHEGLKRELAALG